MGHSITNSTVVKKVISALFARGIVAASGFLVTLFLPRFFAIEDVGFIYFTIAQATFLSVLCRLGIDSSVNPILKVDSDRNNTRLLVANGLLVILIISIFIVFSYYVLLRYVDIFSFKITNNLWFLALWVWSLSFAINYFTFQFFRFNGRLILASFTRGLFGNLALLIVLLFSLIYPISLGSYQIVLTFALMALTFSVVNVVSNLKSSRPEIRSAVSLAKRSPKFMFYSLLIILSTDMDYWVISALLEKRDLAIYSTMKRVALLCAIFIDLANLIIPSLSSQVKTTDEFAKLLRKLSLLFSMLSFVAFIVTYLFGESIVIKLFGQQYTEGYAVLCILMLTFCVSIATGFSEIFLILNDQKNILVIASIFGLVVSLVSNVLLIKHYGIVGAAYSFMVTVLLIRFSLTAFVRNKYKCNLIACWK